MRDNNNEHRIPALAMAAGRVLLTRSSSASNPTSYFVGSGGVGAAWPDFGLPLRRLLVPRRALTLPPEA